MRFGVLVSGRGSNLQSLLDAEREGRLDPGVIACVVSNRPGVQALTRASDAGKPAIVVDHKAYPSRESFEAALVGTLEAHGVQAVVLAGFMRLLTPGFVARWRDRLINIHPSLLPAFPGAHAHRDALAYGVKVSGCTVHFVEPEMDAGPIILQAAVPVLDGDVEETLAARVLAEEHVILPRAVQLLAAGRLSREGRHVRIAPSV